MPSIHRIVPKNVEKAVIFLHGVGANGHDLLGLSAFLRAELPDNVAYISPDGWDLCDLAPPEMMQNSYQWFSLRDRSPISVTKELYSAVPRFIKMLDDISRDLNIATSDIVLVGFSQGSMLAMTVALVILPQLSGVVSFSGAFIAPTSKQIVSRPSFCIIHGRDDDVVPFVASEDASKKLTDLGCDVELHLYDNLSHTIDDRGLQDMILYIKKCFNS
jgi:phospholipase/carboxylesterase